MDRRAAPASNRISKLGDFFRSPHIQLALATGVSIIALAYVSKRVLPEPMNPLALAFPPFLAVLAEGLVSKYGDSWYGASWTWVLAILSSTVLVIGCHLI